MKGNIGRPWKGHWF